MIQNRDQPIASDYSNTPILEISSGRDHSEEVLRASKRSEQGNEMITQSRLKKMANFLFVLLVACFPVREARAFVQPVADWLGFLKTS